MRTMHLTYCQKMAATTMLVVLIILPGLAEGTVRLHQWLNAGHAGQIGELFQVDDDLLVLVPGSRTRTIRINSLGIYHATNDLSWEIRTLAAEMGMYNKAARGNEPGTTCNPYRRFQESTRLRHST